ncbi:MAG: FkbM family methyltransferase, partial [Planctomycetota bacterium]
MNKFGTMETGRKDRIVGLYSQAHNLAIGGNYAQALELYDRIVADVPGLISKTPQINYERALCLKALGRVHDAEQVIQSCLSVRPDDPELLRFLSEIRFGEESSDASRESKAKPAPANVEKAEEADRLYVEVRRLLPLVEKADVERALRAISLIEADIVGRWCGELGDKLLQYLSIVQVTRATGSKAIDSIEIGTLFGGSCLARLFAMRDLGVQGKVVCIDPMTGYYDQQLDPNAGIPVTAEVFFRNIDSFGFSREAIDLREVKSEDPQALTGLREKSFATLLIDGDHSYRGVRYDWENYSKFVCPDGTVLFDDYTNRRWPDIGVFVNELKGSLPRGWKELGCLGTTLLLRRSVDSWSEQEEAADKNKIYEGLNKCYFSKQCHEKEVIDHLPELLDGVKVFVDIGASLGQYTLHANRYMQGGEIFAIEADPLRFEELERNCLKWQLSSSNKLSALLAAVCDKGGQETFYVTNSGKSGGLFKRDVGDESANWSQTEVDCVTLDGLFKDKSPDLVKIDVEGAELRVLKGAARILKEGKTKFLVEVHGGVDPEGQKEPVEVFRFMQSFGYRTINFHGRSLFVNAAATNKGLSTNREQTATAQDGKQNDLAASAISQGLRDFANGYSGRRAFIIGNGPSLNKMDLSFLKNEITFGVNSIFYNFGRMGFKPTFYVVEDKLVAEDRAEEINALTGMTKVFGTDLQYCLKDSEDVIWANVIYDFSNYPGFPHFSKDASECLWVGGTVSYLCMQLAYYMGLTEVYLVGFDHNYIIPADAKVEGTVITSISSDPNHFHPDYFGKGQRWHDPRLDRMEKAYDRAKEVFEAGGRKIFNSTVGGKLDIFPRVDYESLFCCDSDDGGKFVDFCSMTPAESMPAVENELTVKQPQTPRFSHLVLDYTRLCNSKCTYCGIWKMKNGPELSLEAIERLFCSLRPFGLSTCYVTGGEPYISDKIVDIARLLHKYLPKCRLSGATNGVQPDKILKRMQEILEIGVALEVHVSINGSEATHDATRGGSGLFKNAVYLLETLKSAKLPAVASMSLMPQTIADLPYMQEFCAERDIRLMFSWVRQWERYGSVDDQYSTWPEQMKSRLKEIEYLPDTFDCPGLSKRLVITPEGSVYPCEVYNPEILLGNVNEESLESILTSGRAASIAQLIAAKGCMWCQGAGEEHFRQADHLPAKGSREVIKSLLSEKSAHPITLPTAQQSPEVTSDKKNKVRISAIICTYRNPQLLASTIQSLLNQTLQRDLFEIIVVDNNSQDQTRQVVQPYAGVRYVLEEKLGLSYARNTGIEAACGDIIAFIDDDAEASSGWLESLLEIYDSIPEAWAVGGKVLPIWDATKPEWLTERYYRSLSLVEWGQSARPLHWPERIIGTNCSFRRRVFTEIGLFDTNLGRVGRVLLGEEDREIQQRIHKLGHLVYYTPKAIVHHHVPVSRMTSEYFERRSKGTLVCEKIMALRSQGRHEQASQLSNQIREKVESSDIISRQQKALAESNHRLAQFKDKHRGQRCVIIGNGPSLNKMDLSFLKNEITFGMNRIYLLFDKWGFTSTYYVSVNPLVIEQSVEPIRQITAPRFLALEGLPFTGPAEKNIFLQRRPGGAYFSDDPRRGCWWPTVTYAAMQLAYFMGFSEVILIGVDHYFKTKGDANKEIVSAGLDEDHFHPDYFGKGIRWNLPDLEKSEMAYRLAKQAFEAAGRRILDATVDGHLTIFPKADYKGIFFPTPLPAMSFESGLSSALVDTEFEEYFRTGNEKDGASVASILPKLDSPVSVESQEQYLVSAIVSTYNSECFLRGCLEDLERQTIAKELEIIVVNSGSQQNEEAIVKEFQQKYDNIVYIKTEEREGIYAAWNRAVKAARGEFITNANTDDRHREDALEIMARTLQGNPDVALVYGDQICTDTANGSFGHHHTLKVMKQPEYSRERLLFGNCVGSQPMWRGSLHNEIGYFDEMLTCAGDWDFWLRISSKYRFKHIPEFLGLYYHNEYGIEHGRTIHSLYERYIVGKRYGNPYISVISRYESRDNPLVSVIIPAYNAAKYITEAIESVLIQNYRNFELIIIDDGSTDETKDIIGSFKDDRIRYFYQANSGLAATHNAGIKNSKGAFIIKLDADDMMTPDFIARHLMEFEQHPEADLVYCDDCLVGEDTKPIRVIERPEYT